MYTNCMHWPPSATVIWKTHMKIICSRESVMDFVVQKLTVFQFMAIKTSVFWENTHDILDKHGIQNWAKMIIKTIMGGFVCLYELRTVCNKQQLVPIKQWLNWTGHVHIMTEGTTDKPMYRGQTVQPHHPVPCPWSNLGAVFIYLLAGKSSW